MELEELDDFITRLCTEFTYIEGMGDGIDMSKVPPEPLKKLLSEEQYEKYSKALDDITNDICWLIKNESAVLLNKPLLKRL